MMDVGGRADLLFSHEPPENREDLYFNERSLLDIEYSPNN